jgi:hypothetical protein
MITKKILHKIKSFKYFLKGVYLKKNPYYIKGLEIESDPFYVKWKKLIQDPVYLKVQEVIKKEESKSPSRTEIINYLLSQKSSTNYLEIGVRNPEDNFEKIKADNKYSVDPGIEFKSNPVDFKMTSDVFFDKLSNNEVLNLNIRFDIIFIDGLHLAEQVDKDIKNAINFIKEDGLIVLHDCNPPSEWHAREDYNFIHTPADEYWNGTTWKAFLKWRFNPTINSCCIDSDWGVGILSKKYEIGKSIDYVNPFFEYKILEENRKHYLNLVDFSTFKSLIVK